MGEQAFRIISHILKILHFLTQKSDQILHFYFFRLVLQYITGNTLFYKTFYQCVNCGAESGSVYLATMPK